MRNERIRVAMFVSLVFLCGVLAGALGVNLYEHMRVSADAPAAPPSGEQVPSTTRKRAVRWFAEELRLGPEQTDQLARILEETRASYKEHEREIDEVRHQAHNRIRRILNDQQREKFNQLLAQRKAQREARQKAMKRQFSTGN